MNSCICSFWHWCLFTELRLFSHHVFPDKIQICRHPGVDCRPSLATHHWSVGKYSNKVFLCIIILVEWIHQRWSRVTLTATFPWNMYCQLKWSTNITVIFLWFGFSNKNSSYFYGCFPYFILLFTWNVRKADVSLRYFFPVPLWTCTIGHYEVCQALQYLWLFLGEI